MRALPKYLRGHAEREIAVAEDVRGLYARALVVPAYRESPSLLDGFLTAARAAPGRTLCVLVVNGPVGASDAACRENAHLLGVLEETLESVHWSGHRRAFLGSVARSPLDVLVIDRASDGLRLPVKQGVGLARKIGADVALALHAQGSVESPLIFFTDADATLPEDHFVSSITGRHAPPRAQRDEALVFPFVHEPSGDASIDDATALYELGLRYYVAGLRFAGSPYAFHTLGSAMAVTAEAYAEVRGVPKRAAAEDFYLLNKVAKVGRVALASSGAVRIRSRRSDRTPFGTGASLDRPGALERAFYDPRSFVVLRAVIDAIAAFAVHGDVTAFIGAIDAQGQEGAVVRRVFDRFGFAPAFDRFSREAPDAHDRLLRAHGWFDGFRTLKLIHALRAELFPSVPWREAVRSAPFAPEESRGFGDVK